MIIYALTCESFRFDQKLSSQMNPASAPDLQPGPLVKPKPFSRLRSEEVWGLVHDLLS